MKQHPADSDGSLDVHSVFTTIQGEGPSAGCASVFVRLHGCSLACSFCDTEFEARKSSFSPEALLHYVRTLITNEGFFQRPLIVITGGEPLRQNVVPFVTLAAANRFPVQIETAGIHWWAGLEHLTEAFDDTVQIVCSPKTSKVAAGIAVRAVAFKYIISADDEPDAHDGLPMMAVSQRGQAPTARLWRPPIHDRTWVQPLDSGNAEDNRRHLRRCVELVGVYGYRLSLQQHKILGLP